MSITYTTDTAQRTFLLNNGRFGDLWVGVVIREDARGRTPVWTSNGYLDKKAARFQATLRKAECAKYLKATGRDWRDDQDKLRDEDRAAKKARVEARKRLNEAAPALLAALEAVLPVLRLDATQEARANQRMRVTGNSALQSNAAMERLAAAEAAVAAAKEPDNLSQT
jgi:hypothetical protein